MRSNAAAPQTAWRKKLVGGALVLLSLAAIGPPKSWAQLQFNGGYVQTHRQDAPLLQFQQYALRPSAPPSVFPDNDFEYPSFSPAAPSTRPTTSPSRSYAYYYAGGSPSTSTRNIPFGISSAVLPWNRPGFQDYAEVSQTARMLSSIAPRKYSLEVTPLSPRPLSRSAASALLVAHLPQLALLWVEGVQTHSTGRTRYFESPPLPLDRKYYYTVRAAWIEDGHWVSQLRKVPVQAGMIQTIYLHYE